MSISDIYTLLTDAKPVTEGEVVRGGRSRKSFALCQMCKMSALRDDCDASVGRMK